MWGSIPFTPEKMPHFPPERRPTSNGILPRFAPESLPHFDRNPHAQIVVYGVDDLLPGACPRPGTLSAATCADFGHDYQIIGIRMQRLPDDLIRHMRTVEVAGVDVIHAGCHSF